MKLFGSCCKLTPIRQTSRATTTTEAAQSTTQVPHQADTPPLFVATTQPSQAKDIFNNFDLMKRVFHFLPSKDITALIFVSRKCMTLLARLQIHESATTGMVQPQVDRTVHFSSVPSVLTISFNQQLIAANIAGDVVLAFDISTSYAIYVHTGAINPHRYKPIAMSFLPDNTQVAVAVQNTVGIYNVPISTLNRRLNIAQFLQRFGIDNPGYIVMTFIPNKVVVAHYNSIGIFDSQHGSQLHTITCDEPTTCISQLPSISYNHVIACTPTSIIIYDTELLQQILSRTIPENIVGFAISNSEKNTFAIALDNGYIHIYDINLQIGRRIPTTGHPCKLSISPNGRLLAYSINDNITIVDLETGQTVSVNNPNVVAISFSPDSTNIVIIADIRFDIIELRRMF